MINQVQLRQPGTDTVIDLTTHLVTHYWMSKPNMKERDWLSLMDKLIRDDFRVEGYVIEDGVLLSVHIANPAVDPHYGNISVPVIDWVRPTFRGNVELLRQHHSLRRQCACRLQADGYLTVKHVNPTTQLQRVRYFPWAKS